MTDGGQGRIIETSSNTTNSSVTTFQKSFDEITSNVTLLPCNNLTTSLILVYEVNYLICQKDKIEGKNATVARWIIAKDSKANAIPG